MSYFDTYKNKLNNTGGSPVKTFENRGKDYISKYFKEDPSYKEAVLTNSEFEEYTIDIRVENIDKTTEEKKFVFMPNTIVKQGDYISYEDKSFIIEEVETNTIAPVASVLLCNQTINWLGLPKPIPCFITNDAYGSKILADNAILSTTDTKAKLTIQNNKYTKLIKRDWRFIFDESEFDIFKTIDITKSMYEGRIVLIMKKDKLMEEDDLENNIAFNEDLFNESKKEYFIKGDDFIKVNQSTLYLIEDINEVKWEIDDTSIARITTSYEGICEVKALLKDETFVLVAKDLQDNIICEKVITTIR